MAYGYYDKGIAKPKAEVISAVDSFFTKALNSKLNLEASAELTSHLGPMFLFPNGQLYHWNTSQSFRV